MPRDLHLIIGKAMAREPARRYQSVTELAADVERFLESRPVLARAPGPLYITLRFARRHKALAASGTVALLALVVSAIWVVQEQRRAERYYRISRDTATFLLRELVEPLNDHLGIREVHKDLLQQALRRTEAFSRQEAADFDVQHARAVIIAALADIAEAEQRHEDAHRMVDEVLGLRQRLADEEPGDRTRQADLSVAIVRKGDQVAKLGGPRAALPHYMRALAIDERLHAADPTHPRFASNLAWSYDRLGALYRQLDEFETSLGYFHRNVRFLDRLESLNVKRDDLARCLASSHTHLSIIARARGDFETALQHARRAQVVAEEALNVAANSRVAALSSGAAWTTLGVALIDLGRYAEALQCFEGMHRDVFPIFERSPGDRAVRSHYLAAAAWGGRLAIDLQDAEAASNWKERWRTVAGSLEHWPPPNKLGTFR